VVMLYTIMFQNKNVYIVPTEFNSEACVDLRTNSKFILYHINLLFLTDRESVYCAVRCGFLYKTNYVSSHES